MKSNQKQQFENNEECGKKFVSLVAGCENFIQSPLLMRCTFNSSFYKIKHEILKFYRN